MTRCFVVSPNHPVELDEIDLQQLPTPSAWGGSLIYVRLPSGFEVEYLDHELDRILGSLAQEADPVILRCHGEVRKALSQSPAVRRRLRKRFPDARILILTWNTSSAVHEVVDMSDGFSVSDEAEILPILRSVDFQSGLMEPGAMLPSNPEFHYEGPNGRHYSRFVRTGFAFQSVDSMEGVGFWLLPHLYKIDVILLDSWTMLGLGYTIANYAIREAPHRVLNQPAVLCSEEYGEEDTLEQRLAVAVGGVGDSARGLIVTSVHSTGATENRLVAAAGQANLAVAKVVRFYASAEEPPSVGFPRTVTLHVLDEPIESNWPGSCTDCSKERKSVVPVDRRSLLLSLTAAVEEARVTRSIAVQTREFLERYSDVGPVSVHRSTPDGLSHHMVYVDVEKLMHSPTFQARASETAQFFAARVQVVLSPTHSAAVTLAKHVAAEIGVHHVACEQGAYGNLTGDDRAALFGAEGILFVDDVAITGTRIRRVKSSLMRSRVITDSKDADVMMLVGVARPPLERAWAGVVDMIGRDNFRAVERLLLPAWGSEECPWCAELRELTQFRKSQPVSSELTDRIQRLLDTQEGLSEHLFLPSSLDAGGSVRALSAEGMDASQFESAQATPPIGYKVSKSYPFSELGQNSIFGRLKEAELFVAVAAALQKLRDASELSERSQYPLSRVLDPYLYFMGRFYANLIVACVLRAARRRDLRTVGIEPLLRKAVGERLNEDESAELKLEIIFAIAQGKLPFPEEAASPAVYLELDQTVRTFGQWLIADRRPS